MSDSCEPPMKKSKVSIESDVLVKDRIIIAGKKQFSVNSDVLASKSEYFRILFESDFKEKDQETIELNEISAESFEQFLLVIERPEDFKATKGKLIDLIATLAYFNATDLLKPILEDKTNFNKVPKKDLLELARTFAIPYITKMIEDWYLLVRSPRFQYLQFAVEYGLERLETKLFESYNFIFIDCIYEILNDDSELGEKVYQRIKQRVFEEYPDKNRMLLCDFVSQLNETQFDDVKDEVESLILKNLEDLDQHEIVEEICDIAINLRKRQVRKMKKIKAFAVDYLIAEYLLTHDWFIIHSACKFNLESVKVFLKDYLITNYANLNKSVKKQMEFAYGDAKELIREATQSI